MSSPTKPTTCIDDLPPEMIHELFKHFGPKDLAACSMVNRRWHSIYADFKLHRLVATDYDYDYSNQIYKWSYPDREEIERCSIANFPRLAEKPLLSNLKHLALCGYSFEFDLNELNRFGQLAHLEIHDCPDGQVHLNLPRLEVLVFHLFDRCALSIDCPHLSTLVYYNWAREPNLLDVKHPETIRKLETNLLGSRLTSFKSVECLVAPRFEAISKATLLSLPRLKELHYDEDIKMLFLNKVGALERVRRTLSEFMDDVKVLGRWSDFQFRFAGFPLTRKMLDEFDFGVQVDEGRERVCREYVYLKNYQLIEPGAMHFVHRVDYTDLLSNLTGEFPRCFSQKFTEIHWVQATAEVQDENHFLWFLKSLRFLRVLDLVCLGLSQEFYDQLPASAHSRVRLELRGDEENELQLSFDFIGKLLCLSNLTIWDPPLSFESATSLTRSLGKLAEGTFYVRSKGERLSIKKIGSKVWTILKFKQFDDNHDYQLHDNLFDDYQFDHQQVLFKTENSSEIVSFFFKRL